MLLRLDPLREIRPGDDTPLFASSSGMLSFTSNQHDFSSESWRHTFNLHLPANSSTSLLSTNDENEKKTFHTTFVFMKNEVINEYK